MVDTKEARLKAFAKEQIRKSLLKIGRRLVVEKGSEYLTARKLSDASNTSVGTIYNTFYSMENYIQQQNMQTLDELYAQMNLVVPQKNPFVNINRYVLLRLLIVICGCCCLMHICIAEMKNILLLMCANLSESRYYWIMK